MRLFTTAIAALMLCGSAYAQDWTQNPFAPSPPGVASVPAVDWHQPLFSVDELQAEQLALAKAVKEGLRPVYVWSMSANCPPCIKLERDKRDDAKTIIKAGLVLLDGPKTFPAVKPDLVPTFRWQDIRGGWRIHVGWTNTKEFLELVANTDKAAERAQARVTTPARYPTTPAVREWVGAGETRAEIIAHLLTSPDHRGKFSRGSLEILTLAQLRALHGDDHDGAVRWDRLAIETSTSETEPPPTVVAGVR